MKNDEKSPPPYHVFMCHDKFFVFDTTSCRFYTINELSYYILLLLLDHDVYETKELLLAEERYSEKTINSVMDSWLKLGKDGLFDVPIYETTPDILDISLDKINSIQPWSIELMLTEHCNLACKYCFCSSTREIPAKKMSNVTIKKAIDMLFRNAVRSKTVDIVFFGGEPLLNREGLLFALKYSQELAKQHNKKIFYRMTTNGTIFDFEIEAIILEYNIAVMISLDGPKNIHDKQCPQKQGKGSFDAVERTIKRLLELQYPIEIRCTLTHPMTNLKKIFEFMEEIGNNKFKRVVIAPAVNPSYCTTAVDFRQEDYENYSKQFRDLLPWMVSKIGKSKDMLSYFNVSSEIDCIYKGKIKSNVRLLRCSACFGRINVAPNGNLYPCARLSGVSVWETGHVDSGQHDGAHKNFWKKYNSVIREYCSLCWAYSICKGPCPGEVCTEDGGFHVPSNCSFIRSHIEDVAYLYTNSPDLSGGNIK